MRIAGRGSAWPAFGLMLCTVLISSGAPGQAPQPRAPAQFQSGEPAPDTTMPDAPTPPPPQAMPGAPGTAPGFLDAFTRWMQDSTAGFNAGAWSNTKGMSDAASNAARTTTDVAKGAADVVTGVARDTAGALSRLPAARVAAGRERCTVAPNGAPDCRIAAESLCRAKGFASGSSIDFETAEVCPSAATLARWRGEPATCTTENYVTRALCQ